MPAGYGLCRERSGMKRAPMCETRVSQCGSWGVRLLAAGLILLGSAEVPEAAEWPQWRGPDGQGHAPGARELPTEWRAGGAEGPARNVVWRVPIPGRAWSSPVIDGEAIWLVTAIESGAAQEGPPPPGQKKPQPRSVAERVVFRAICLDRNSGQTRQDVELFTVDHPQPTHVLNSFASPSPVLSGGRLYCQLGDYGTACLDTAAATVVWKNRSERLSHENGPGGSPVIWQDRLIFHCDGSDVQSIVAFDTATGAVVWKTPRSGVMNENPELKKAYGTPLVLTLGGRDVLLSPAADWLYAYDPADGKELWKLAYGVLGFSIVPRPVAAHGLVFVGTSFMKPELLAVRVGDAGAAATPEIVWRATKGVPSMPSPLVVGDELYMVSDKGIATCLDARSGEPIWTERLGGNFSSSPLAADGKIYVGNRDGDLFVLRPGRTFELLATNAMGEAIMASPAAVDRAIYLRTDAALYRIENTVPGAGR